MGDAGDLISGSRIIRNTIDVQLGSIDVGGQKAKGGGSHQQLLEKLHWDLTPKRMPARHASRKGYLREKTLAIRTIQKMVICRLKHFFRTQNKKLPTEVGSFR